VRQEEQVIVVGPFIVLLAHPVKRDVQGAEKLEPIAPLVEPLAPHGLDLLLDKALRELAPRALVDLKSRNYETLIEKL